jgi:hypothetical protein
VNNTTATDETVSDLHKLDVKALTTKMTVYPEAPGVWLVQHNNEHHVSRVDGEFHCDCKGYQHGHECYHVRRLMFELGVRDVPAWANKDAIDEQFRAHVGPALADGGLFREGRERYDVVKCEGGNGEHLVYDTDIDKPGRRCIGYTHVDGAQAVNKTVIRDALRARGHAHGIADHGDVFEPAEVGL